MMLCDGSLAEGTLDLPDLSGLEAENIQYGVKVAGLTGTLRPARHCKNGLGYHSSTVDLSSPWDGWIPGSTVSVTDGSATISGSFTHATLGMDVKVNGEVRRIVNWSAASIDVDSPFDFTDATAEFYFKPPSYDGSTDDYFSNKGIYEGQGVSPCNISNFSKVTDIDGNIPDTSKHAAWSNIFQDELTGLRFTNVLETQKNWGDSMAICAALNGGSAGDGWRLPGQKELMQLHINGVSRIDPAEFGDTLLYFSSSTWHSSSGHRAYVVNLANGIVGYPSGYKTTNTDYYTGNKAVICVK